MVEKLAQHDLDVAARIKEERREAFLTWLAGAEFEGKHLEINAKTYPGTCSWIQQRLEFDIWLQNSGRPVLWCEGKPGIGKSVLASNVIEFIKAKFAMAQPTAVTYVYYDQQEAKLTSISELIRSLIQQLCYQIDEIPESLLQLKRSCQSPLAIATPSNLARLVQSFHRTFLVVDALDECQSDHRHQVIQLILGCENIPFNVFVTSRRDSDILDSFTCPNVTVLNMTAFDVADDIHHFVTGQVKSLRKRGHGRRLYLQDDALEQTIITELTEGSDGMFLWVDLQLINLCRISKSKQDELVRDTLTSLPQGLEKTYDQILKQIEDNGGYMRTLAERSFMWVLYADRPLRKVELQQAVKTNPGPFLQADQLDLDISSLEVIFDACGSLLIEAGDFIRPIHFSVKEYFLSDGVTGPNMFSLLRDPTLVSEVLALSCLNHLMELLQPQSSWKNIYDLQDFIRAHPLVVHASQVFDHHVAGATHMSTTLRASLQSFFDQRQEFHAAILQLRTIVYPVTLNDLLFSTQSVLSDANAGTVLYSTRLYDTLGQHPLCQDLQPPKYMLHQAAAGGHALLCIRCIENGEDVNQPDGNGTSPIYHACLGGHEQVVSTLIDYQANIDIKGGHYGCPLQAAAYRGHMRVIEILIHRGADLIGHGGAFSSALAAAAAGGHEQAAYVLLMAGADVNYQGNKNSDRPLHLACAGGHKAVVKLILKQANVEIHAVGRAGGTALAKAAANGHKHLFPLLIDAAGVDIDLVSKHYGTALQAAAAEGHYDVFRDLIDRGADALVQGGRFGTCIQAASAGGNAEIVKMLLDQKNVPVNVVDGHYGTALQAASALGHLKIMKMLLDASAKVNIQGGHHGTSLQAAACWNHKEAVVMLLEHGAKVNASAGYHGTALQAACAGTHRDVVQLLLSRGADPRLEAGYYGTPLQAAAAKGDVETVQSLLGRGADAKQGGGKYRDAVHAATAKGHLDVVEILLESQVLN
ncbi:ankyrin repeat-containing domain protein [Aspergillus taichungensis]|uniref:Ankyrin repeat-containing domain protein n=1 Tax=Aspergillus taichungensis TaxID=482145 RepID=A0A2J5I0V1_9EURO|nr:ankyrin repeat-containing domain protein [Aspergillus taichungensis]